MNISALSLSKASPEELRSGEFKLLFASAVNALESKFVNALKDTVVASSEVRVSCDRRIPCYRSGQLSFRAIYISICLEAFNLSLNCTA